MYAMSQFVSQKYESFTNIHTPSDVYTTNIYMTTSSIPIPHLHPLTNSRAFPVFCHVQLPLLSFALAQSVSIIFPAPRNNNLTNVYHDSNKHNSNYDNNNNNNLTGPAIATIARTVRARIACSEFDPCLSRPFDSCTLMPAYKVLARPIGSSSMKEWC